MSSRNEKAGSKFKPTLGRGPPPRPRPAASASTVRRGPAVAVAVSAPTTQGASQPPTGANSSDNGSTSSQVWDTPPVSTANRPTAAPMLTVPNGSVSLSTRNPSAGAGRTGATPIAVPIQRSRVAPTSSPNASRAGTPRATQSLAQPMSHHTLASRPMSTIHHASMPMPAPRTPGSAPIPGALPIPPKAPMPAPAIPEASSSMQVSAVSKPFKEHKNSQHRSPLSIANEHVIYGNGIHGSEGDADASAVSSDSKFDNSNDPDFREGKNIRQGQDALNHLASPKIASSRASRFYSPGDGSEAKTKVQPAVPEMESSTHLYMRDTSVSAGASDADTEQTHISKDRRRKRHCPILPTYEQEKQRWQKVWNEYQSRVTEHSNDRQVKANKRAARREIGSDVEDTTSESELSEPELILPPDMQGPEESASMSDLTAMRWTRGVPRDKTFELTERHAAWQKEKSLLAKQAQRRLERRMSRGKEFWQRDEDSEESSDEDAHDNALAKKTLTEDGQGEVPIGDEDAHGVKESKDPGSDSEEEQVGVVDSEDEEEVGNLAGISDHDDAVQPDKGKDPACLPPARASKFQDSGTAAQFRIRDDGTIDVDPDSLLMDRNKEAWEQAEDDHVDPTVIGDEWAFTNSASFASTTRKGKTLGISKDGESAVTSNMRWSKQETEEFISAVRLWGTDFGMVARAFPKRTRTQIVAKWRKMEAENPALLDSIFKKKTPLKRSGTSLSSRAATPAGSSRHSTPSVLSRSYTPLTAVSTPRTAAVTPALEEPEAGHNEPDQNLSRDPSIEPRAAFKGAKSQVLEILGPADRTDEDEFRELETVEEPGMSLEEWATKAKFDLDLPTPKIELPTHIQLSLEREMQDEDYVPNSTAGKRSHSQIDKAEYEEEEEIEILPDGSQRITVHRVKKRCPRQRVKKPPQVREMEHPQRDHAHRADVLARQAGLAAGESEELVGNYSMGN